MTTGEAFSITVLAIDDDPACREVISDALSRDGFKVLSARDSSEGLQLVQQEHPQIVLLDWMMPGGKGGALLEGILEADSGTDVILMTHPTATESAVAAIQNGASEYLTKPLEADRLWRMVDGLAAEARQRHRTLQLDRELVDSYQFEGIVGRSPLMLEVYSRIRRVAPHFRTVLVTGTTGTGKELVARALHKRSPYAAGPFVVCNCSAVVETIFESELFGYVKGAFTGATQDKVGYFEYAQGGTLLLDEIGEMPLTTQAKLLRVLQSQEIQRVGSPTVRKTDVRVVASTNRDLRTMMATGQFREDLYYRLSMVEIHLPLLAERKEDVPLLQRYFVEHFAGQYKKPIRGITRRAQALLARYPWPGNVRELENVLGNACMMVEGKVIDISDLPEHMRYSLSELISAEEKWVSLEEFELRYALQVLEHTDGNKVRAAEVLGISRATLYRLIGQKVNGQKVIDGKVQPSLPKQ
ncbi:MAG: sigma-54-dependent Fis family transcriptional regulator [Acidobacteria bacterium]|nr:sigma-54-dependent Fis family transcriptional regulator [Acidobacteriota bacterium]